MEFTIIELLGKENVEELKKGVTELLIERVKDDLEDFDEYLFDYGRLLDEVKDEVEANLKKKLTKIYEKKQKRRLQSYAQNYLRIKI